MVPIGVAVVLAFLVAPAPWGIVLVLSAVAWEVAEKGFWLFRVRRIPLAVGPEAMIGQAVDVTADCSPNGTVRLAGERWNATCSQGAEVGDTVIVQAIDRLTLIVAPAR